MAALCCVSRALRTAASDPDVWQALLSRDFPGASVQPGVRASALYGSLFKERRRLVAERVAQFRCGGSCVSMGCLNCQTNAKAHGHISRAVQKVFHNPTQPRSTRMPSCVRWPGVTTPAGVIGRIGGDYDRLPAPAMFGTGLRGLPRPRGW